MKTNLTLLMAVFFSTVISVFAVSFGGGYNGYKDKEIRLYYSSDASVLVALFNRDALIDTTKEFGVNIVDRNTGEFIADFIIPDSNYFNFTDLDENLQTVKIDTNAKYILINNFCFNYLNGDKINPPSNSNAIELVADNPTYNPNTIIESHLDVEYYNYIGNPDDGSYKEIMTIENKINTSFLNIIPSDYIGKGGGYQKRYISDDEQNIFILSKLELVTSRNHNNQISQRYYCYAVYNIDKQKLRRYIFSTNQFKSMEDCRFELSYDTSKINVINQHALYRYDFKTGIISDTTVFTGINSIRTFTNENRYLLLYSADSVKVWDDSSKSVIATFKDINTNGRLNFSTENKVISIFSDNKVTQYDFTSNSVREFYLPNLQSMNYSISDISSDGMYLLCEYFLSSERYYVSWDVKNDIAKYEPVKFGIKYLEGGHCSSKFLIAPHSFTYQVINHLDWHGYTHCVNVLNSFQYSLLSNNTNNNASYICAINQNVDKVLSYYYSGKYQYRELPNKATTSVQELNFDDLNVEIYPNPASEIISINGISEGNYTLRISNINGELIHSANILISGNSKFEFDINTFTTGAYVLELKNSSQSYTGKFNKVK